MEHTDPRVAYRRELKRELGDDPRFVKEIEKFPKSHGEWDPEVGPEDDDGRYMDAETRYVLG